MENKNTTVARYYSAADGMGLFLLLLDLYGGKEVVTFYSRRILDLLDRRIIADKKDYSMLVTISEDKIMRLRLVQ